MKYTLEVIRLDRDNEDKDLVKLLGGQKNCFHIRKNPKGGLRKLTPLKAVVLDENATIVGDAPANVVEELVASRLDVGDTLDVMLEYRDMGGKWYPYEHWMGKAYPEFYLDRLRPRFNEDGTVMCAVTVPTLRRRPNRIRQSPQS
jgi:hypothetical protein